MKFFVLGLALILIVINYSKNKKNKFRTIIKTKKTFYLAKPKNKKFTSICLMLNYFNFRKITHKLRTIKLVDHIISCVKFNIPKLYTKHIDYQILRENKIDVNSPVLVIKNFDLHLLNCFYIASKYCKFNLVFKDSNSLYFKENLKILNKLNYYILKENCNKNLYVNIMRANIYNLKKFKIKHNRNDFEFTIINGKNKLCEINNVIKNNIYNFCNQNINVCIEIKKYNGVFICFKITNKTNNLQTIKLKIFKNLIGKKLYINDIPNGLKFYNIKANYSIKLISDSYIKKIVKDKITSGVFNLELHKKIILESNEIYKFNFYLGNQILSKTQICDLLKKHSDLYQNITSYKIKCLNKSIEYLFNIYLPNQIKFENLERIQKIHSENYIEVYNEYKSKNISCLDFYIWLKSCFFGIVENEKYINVIPKYEGDFDIYFIRNGQSKTIRVSNKGEKNRYLQIGGVIYHNYSIIPKSKLEEFNTVSLVL